MNDNHTHVLGTYLHDIEMRLQEMRRGFTAESDELSRTMYLKQDVDEETRARVLKGITKMLKEIESMKVEYGLQTEERSLRKYAHARISDIWVTISDLRPEHLENYGSLTQDDKDGLEPHLKKLLELQGGLSAAL
jgi:hypothetical protein